MYVSPRAVGRGGLTKHDGCFGDDPRIDQLGMLEDADGFPVASTAVTHLTRGIKRSRVRRSCHVSPREVGCALGVWVHEEFHHG